MQTVEPSVPSRQENHTGVREFCGLRTGWVSGHPSAANLMGGQTRRPSPELELGDRRQRLQAGRWLSHGSSGQRGPQQPPQQPWLWVLPEHCDLWLPPPQQPPPQQPPPLLRCLRRLLGKQQQPVDTESQQPEPPQQPESPQQLPESPPQQPPPQQEDEAAGTGAGTGAGAGPEPWEAPLG